MISKLSKKFLLVFLAVVAGFGLVFSNWYLVDPFHLRAMPATGRYLVNGLGGLLLAALFYFSFRMVVKNWAALKAGWAVFVWCVVGVAVCFLLPLPLAPSRFTSTWVEVRVNNQPEAVRLQSIQAGTARILLEKCLRQGAWEEDTAGGMTVRTGNTASMRCQLVRPFYTPVSAIFDATSQPVTVALTLDQKGQNIDLSHSSGNQAVTVHRMVPLKIGDFMAVSVRLADALLLILLGCTLDLWLGLPLVKALSPYQNAISTGFLSWFNDTTPAFQGVVAFFGIIAILLTLYLFLQPALVTATTLPLKAKGQKASPNVIFIVVDALSAEDMSIFGYSQPTTPHLQELTRTWSVYTQAQSAQTTTAEALPSFMTGRYAYITDFSTYGDLANAHSGWLSLPQLLQAAGYQTWWTGFESPGFYHLGAGFTDSACRPGNVLHTALIRSALPFHAMTKTRFPFVPLSMEQAPGVFDWLSAHEECDDSLQSLVDLLPTAKAPFFVYYHYFGVHGFPYPGGDYLGALLPKEAGMVSFDDQAAVYGKYALKDQPQVDKLRLRYDEAVMEQDQRLGEFIAYLKETGLYASSMIIITGDHGQNFNNGYTSHATPLVSYAEAHVPLLIKYPYQTRGERIDRLVSTVDLAPTLLDIAGIAYSPDWLDGTSLLGQAEPDRIVFTRQARVNSRQNVPDFLAAADDTYRLVLRDDHMALFDYNSDPAENKDLYSQGTYAQKPEVLRLQRALENFRQRARLIAQGKSILNTPLVP